MIEDLNGPIVTTGSSGFELLEWIYFLLKFLVFGYIVYFLIRMVRALGIQPQFITEECPKKGNKYRCWSDCHCLGKGTVLRFKLFKEKKDDSNNS